MTNLRTPGETFEAVVRASHRIRAVHWILGIVGAFSIWPNASMPYVHPLARGFEFSMIVFSVFGWGPYLISWLYSRELLDGSSRAVNAFSAGALIVTLIGAGLYQNAFGFQEKPPALLVSFGVTVSLIALAKVCSIIRGSRPQ